LLSVKTPPQKYTYFHIQTAHFGKKARKNWKFKEN